MSKPTTTTRTVQIGATAIVAALIGGLLTAQPASALACSAIDYGATVNDSSDDTSEIQAALNSACGVVALPTGTYKISATLTVPSNSGLSGSGTLNQTADVTTILNSNTSTGNSNIELHDFKVSKTFVNNSLADGIRLEKVTGVDITGVEITGISARNGIELLLCDTFLVDDNYLHDYSATATGTLSDGDPVSIDSIYIRTSDNGTVSNNLIEDMAGGSLLQSDGIFVANADNVDVLDNTINNVGEGIDVGNSDDVLVSGNTVSDTGLFGIKVGNGSTTTTVEYNDVWRAQLSGISLFGGASTIAGNGPTEDIIVSRNNIYNVGSAGTSGHPYPGTLRAGISVIGDRSYWAPVDGSQLLNNVIEDNQTTHTMQFGIYIDEYTINNTVADNEISGHTVEGYRNLS